MYKVIFDSLDSNFGLNNFSKFLFYLLQKCFNIKIETLILAILFIIIIIVVNIKRVVRYNIQILIIIT